MTDEPRHPSRLTLAIVAILCVITITLIAFSHCGKSSNSSPSPAPASSAVTCPNGSALGAARSQACPTGQVGAITQTCQASGSTGTWVEVATTCAAPPNPNPPVSPLPSPAPGVPSPPPAPTPVTPPGCPQVTFDTSIEPIMAVNCSTCHLPTYQTAELLGPAEMARRVALPVSDSDHMPQPIGNNPAVSLSPQDVETIQTWVNQGALENCQSAGTTTQFIDLEYQDRIALNDAQSLPLADQQTTEYLYAGDLIDEGFPIGVAVQGINKALNGTNNDSNLVTQVVPVDALGAVYRVDLNAFGIQATDLTAILGADVNLNFVDNTTEGKALTTILGHKPWLNLNNWIDITYRNSAVYYQLIGNPTNEAAFQTIFGINFQQDLETLTNVNFIGSTSSPIAEQKNRLIVRATNNTPGNCYWQTFDVNATPANVQVVVNGVSTVENTKNLIEFPLLANAGALTPFGAAHAVYTPDASEIIGCAPNGFLQYGLVDGAGNRLNFADPNVVIDTETPLGNKVINDANSCVRCHAGGFIPLSDQIYAADGHTTQLAASDVQIVDVLYGADAAAGALFKKDSSIFLQALTLAGITQSQDPMSMVTDDYLLNYNLLKAASRLFLTPAQLTACIQQSAASNAALGNILTPNGQVTFAQFTQALPQLIDDCNLFQDSVGG